MNARLEGFVDDAGAVSGEEENAGVVLELAEEDYCCELRILGEI